MNKREAIWLIVKLIGVYFFYLAFVSLFGLISSVSALYSATPEQISSTKTDINIAVSPVPASDGFSSKQPSYANKNAEKSGLDPASKKVKDEAIKTILWYIFLTGLYGAIAFYLIIDGQILFAVLNREGKLISETKEINSLGIFDDPK